MCCLPPGLAQKFRTLLGCKQSVIVFPVYVLLLSRSDSFILALFSVDILHIFSTPAPARFEFINPAKSGSGRIWKIEIRCIPN